MKPLRQIEVGAVSRAGEFNAAERPSLRWIKAGRNHAA
jgi:hypothetical protein